MIYALGGDRLPFIAAKPSRKTKLASISKLYHRLLVIDLLEDKLMEDKYEARKLAFYGDFTLHRLVSYKRLHPLQSEVISELSVFLKNLYALLK